MKEADDAIFVLEDPADAVDAESPHLGCLLHRVMLLESLAPPEPHLQQVPQFIFRVIAVKGLSREKGSRVSQECEAAAWKTNILYSQKIFSSFAFLASFART